MTQDWSMGDFICACEEVACVPRFQGSQPPLFIELKCFSLNFDPNSGKNCKTISIRDQILFVLFIAFLYRSFTFLFSWLARVEARSEQHSQLTTLFLHKYVQFGEYGLHECKFVVRKYYIHKLSYSLQK